MAHDSGSPADPGEVLAVLHRAAAAVRAELAGATDFGLTGEVAGQHHSDLVADAAALAVLTAAGFGVLSEESGLSEGERDVVVALDPLDGSTNAAQGIPWYAVSLCALDGAGPLASVVVNLPTGDTFEAVRGGGARRNGAPISVTDIRSVGAAMVGISGWPSKNLGWRQFRALGAASLDLCLVACGALDAWVDCSADAHGPWDYLGAMLVCLEAGAVAADSRGRDLIVLEHDARRTLVVAATPTLLADLLAARRSFD
ncbi:MAG TPA: inositol monophosphatase [Acidimicrobiales bacterium]